MASEFMVYGLFVSASSTNESLVLLLHEILSLRIGISLYAVMLWLVVSVSARKWTLGDELFAQLLMICLSSRFPT